MALSLAMVNYNSLKIFENLHTFQILRTFLIFASLRTICSRGDCAFISSCGLLFANLQKMVV